MDIDQTLVHHGLFSSRVPRYTSYPPANRFAVQVGADNQQGWLRQLSPCDPVSVYIHIPFCRRLCWFCACRTQGTQTLRPVADYVDWLVHEIQAAAQVLRPHHPMVRLHLGGGTPTLLDIGTLDRLLAAVFDTFAPVPAFEFSVEIDPTEADPQLLARLASWGMNRASLGIQDFDPEVQEAIGRRQTLAQTRSAMDHLHAWGVSGVNFDLLYGLPHQTKDSLTRTLSHCIDLKPTRMALYGYAHVPWMSKRQVMIPDDSLPDAAARFDLQTLAAAQLEAAGFAPVGIDHFARPGDGLLKAFQDGSLRRNFQGYTDDPAPTLLGFGASAISRFAQGYVQNAVATSAYVERVQTNGLTGAKGYAMSAEDHLLADMIEDIMCDRPLDFAAYARKHPQFTTDISARAAVLLHQYSDVNAREDGPFHLRPEAKPLARIVAATLDQGDMAGQTAHSVAV